MSVNFLWIWLKDMGFSKNLRGDINQEGYDYRS